MAARVFHVSQAIVTLRDMTLTGGDTRDRGGGVNSFRGDLFLTGMKISGNIAGAGNAQGGGVFVWSANLTISHSEISHNASREQAGGVGLQPFQGEYTATISDSVVTGNRGAGGGGIYMRTGHLHIVRSTVTGNNSGLGRGGGIWKLSGHQYSANSMLIQDSTISSNSTEFGYGGGIAIEGNYPAPHAILIENSQITGNQAVRASASPFPEVLGGGIFLGGGNLTVDRSVISNNLTDNTVSSNLVALGGGIAARSAHGMDVSVTVLDSTISGNTADRGGGVAALVSSHGGIYATLSIDGSTLSGNTAATTGGLSGGGLFSYSSINDVSTMVSNSTISGNIGGGAFVNYNRATIQHTTVTNNQYGVAALGTGITEIASSIIAGNGGDVGGDSFQSNGYNIVGFGNLLPFTNSDQTGVSDPMLGPLQDNGGITDTHAPLPGSPAIDAGDPLATAGMGTVPEFDQRGHPFGRVFNHRIDVGAVELQPAVPDCDFDDDADCDGIDIDAARGGNCRRHP